ncbi:transcriptional repressor LexA [Clostridium sp. SHJSY1]|uniref:transcriptional repressor LexA n=1 Tax=Clostridium sp. SHJSY1 TaxID=2942483 RepID=UPI0028743CDD|nr:transcriptional repressor LexA [Clostridium sp. SHJSY1]MDS0524271.1 transcriptional repressor LexA [Clostridium sp. SHJSY1]
MMRLLNIQKKFIKSKPVEISILKGKSNTGKTEAILHRILNLINNFAYEEDDKILVVQKEEKLKDKYLNRYNFFKNENEYSYISLLSTDKEPDFLSFNNIVDIYSKGSSLATLKQKEEIIKSILSVENFKHCKKLKAENMYTIINEIKFIKNHRVSSYEEFMTLMGGPLRLRKNSLARKEMFRFYELYNKSLEEKNLQDHEDRVIYAIREIEEKRHNKYVHIFADNAESFSKLELDLLLALNKKKTYGTITLAVDIDKGENVYSSLVKKGRVYAKTVFGAKKKIFNFKTDVQAKNFENLTILKEEKIEDKFLFVDFKHRRNFEFTLEDNGHEVSFVGETKEKINKNELEDVPVFNNIAAGEPILINPTQEDIFALPKYWVKGLNQKFILKIKGDSMIDANIDDEDLVVIEQNPSPVNGDIVAVNIDGSATLKRIKMDTDEVLLMPENKKYEPIKVTKEQEFYVLGKAIGVIKKI